MGLDNLQPDLPAKREWLKLLKEQANQRDIEFQKDDYAFQLGSDLAGKVHKSEIDNRRQHEDRIWATVTEEVEYAKSSDIEIVSVILNIRSDETGFDPDVDTFLPIPQTILLQESRKRNTESKYDLAIEGAKNEFYEPPYSKLANNWEILFDFPDSSYDEFPNNWDNLFDF